MALALTIESLVLDIAATFLSPHGLLFCLCMFVIRTQFKFWCNPLKFTRKDTQCAPITGSIEWAQIGTGTYLVGALFAALILSTVSISVGTHEAVWHANITDLVESRGSIVGKETERLVNRTSCVGPQKRDLVVDTRNALRAWSVKAHLATRTVDPQRLGVGTAAVFSAPGRVVGTQGVGLRRLLSPVAAPATNATKKSFISERGWDGGEMRPLGNRAIETYLKVRFSGVERIMRTQRDAASVDPE